MGIEEQNNREIAFEQTLFDYQSAGIFLDAKMRKCMKGMFENAPSDVIIEMLVSSAKMRVN